MFDPFANVRVSGSWADHMSYSAGGIDLPLGFGTPIRAPAAGTLRTSGGAGEFRAGNVGTAGRRAILVLDAPVLGLVAIVMQHLSKFAPEGHYDEGDIIGWSGASTIRGDGTVNEYGGDVHLHHHGLLKTGGRVDWRGYITLAPTVTSAAASATLTPIGDDMLKDDEDLKKEFADIKKEVGELRRMLGVLLGWPGAKTPAEVVAQNGPRDAAEARRMTAAILTGSPAPAGAPAEAALWNRLNTAGGGVTVDPAAVARAVNDDAARRLAQ